MTPALVDMHCHLDFFEDPAAVARDAAEAGLAMLAVTCTPADYARTAPLLSRAENVRLAAGLHPWWLANGRSNASEVDALLALIEGTRYVGEVGLDFSTKHAPKDSFALQEEALARIARASAEAGGKLLSAHAVKAAGRVLDILEDTGALSCCDVIFHWFSGSTEELWRAIRAGAFFSVNPMMLATRRAPEYLKLIPDERLLLETDLPPEHPGSPYYAADVKMSLEQSLELLEAHMARDVRSLAAANACALLGW